MRHFGNVCRAIAVLLCSALLTSACTTTRTQERNLLEATATELTDRLRAKAAELQTLKGLFRVQVQGAGLPFPQRVEGAIYYQRPDVYRVQGFNRLGGELFELLMAKEVYRLRLPGPGQQYSGRADQLGRIGPIAEPFALTMFAMSGLIGLAPVPSGSRLALAQTDDRYRLDVTLESADRPSRRLWFDRRTLEVVQEDRLAPDGAVIASAQFEDYRTIGESAAGAGPIVRPFRIEVQDTKAGGMVIVTFQELLPNVPLKAEELRAA